MVISLRTNSIGILALDAMPIRRKKWLRSILERMTSYATSLISWCKSDRDHVVCVANLKVIRKVLFEHTGLHFAPKYPGSEFVYESWNSVKHYYSMQTPILNRSN